MLATIFHCQPLRCATRSRALHSPMNPGSSIRSSPIARNVSSHQICSCSNAEIALSTATRSTMGMLLIQVQCRETCLEHLAILLDPGIDVCLSMFPEMLEEVA